MRVQTEEWRRFIPGVRMYKGKMTLFYNGEKLWDEAAGKFVLYSQRKRNTWEVIIVLPGVEVIPFYNFSACPYVEKVIMADTVRRIEQSAFSGCWRLKYIKLSKNIEYIGFLAFSDCKFVSIFIPPSCQEIHDYAFYECSKLIICNVPENTELGNNVFARTKLYRESPFEEVDRRGFYRNNVQVNRWVRDINTNQEHALHRACSAYNPLLDIIYQRVRRDGLEAFQVQNAIGITPSQYLEANPFVQDVQKKVVNRYILEMMGETI